MPPDFSTLNPGAACLEKLAAVASTQASQELALARQQDSALLWSAASVHPLQSLETAYQGIVRDACRGIVNPDRRSDVEGQEMSRFYMMDVEAPRLMGGQPPQDPPLFATDQLREAAKQLKKAGKEFDAAKARGGGTDIGPKLLIRLRERLEKARSLTQGVLQQFQTCNSQGAAIVAQVPALNGAATKLQGAAQRIAQMKTDKDFQSLRADLSAAVTSLEPAVLGLCAVQMFHIIEGFYLFRMLVRFRIESDNPITPDNRMAASGVLTGLLNNKRKWVSDFLCGRLVQLGNALKMIDPAGNSLFFLKGGRALNYFLGTPDAGESDWDTQILINPALAPADWYDLLLKIHNEVLKQLEQFKIEFFMEVQKNAGAFMNSLDELQAAQQQAAEQHDELPVVQPAIDPEFDEDEEDYGPLERNRAACKAELIDIGVPRRDTIEASEQWAQLKGTLLENNGIWFPAALYYIEEYVLILRQAFAGTSPSIPKSPKRVRRLYQILMLPGTKDTIDTERDHIPPALLPLSLGAVEKLPNAASVRILIVLLNQFAKAYELTKEPGLAAAFDAFFAGEVPNIAMRAASQYPPAFRDAILKDTQDGNWKPEHQALADAIGFGAWVSGQMQQQLKDRAVFIETNRVQLMQLIRTLYEASVFSPQEELEVQLATATSLAAKLQAEYASFPRMSELEPFIRADLKLYAKNPDANPATVMQLIEPLIDQCRGTLVKTVSPDGLLITLTWPQNVQIGQFNYSPAVLSVSVAPSVLGWPHLSFIWGYPVLSLPDLIREYQYRSAFTQELGEREVLRGTSAAMVEIYTQYDEPNQTRQALQLGKAHHLMISSPVRAIGPGADYPSQYYQPTPSFPTSAFQVTLSPNPAQMKGYFTLPPLPTNGDRSLDLLVLNQGHGGIMEFSDGWRAADMLNNVVQPLVASGVRANIIVLDFCLSATFLSTFAPLCAPGARIISGMYSISTVAVDKDLWGTIYPDILTRTRVNIWTAIDARMRQISSSMTGEVHYEEVRNGWNEQTVTNWLLGHPLDRDAISATRYLPKIRDIIQGTQAPSAKFYSLMSLKTNTNLGPGEQAVLVPVASPFVPTMLDQVEAAFRQRLVTILTSPIYGFNLLPGTLAQLPLFAGVDQPSIWSYYWERRFLVLALAPGLARCPTPFAVYDGDSRVLSLDQALLQSPITQPVAAMLNHVFPGTDLEVPDVIRVLNQQAFLAQMLGVPNFLQ